MKKTCFKIALVLACQILLAFKTQAVNPVSIKTDDGNFVCIVDCEMMIAKVENEATVNSYILSDTIRICGPAANEKVAKWMQKTINEGWNLPTVRYKDKSIIIEVTVIYDKKIDCDNYFSDINTQKLADEQHERSDTVIRLFSNNLNNKEKKNRDSNFATPNISAKDGVLGHAAFCLNFAEIGLVPSSNKYSKNINDAVLLHEFGHLLCLGDKYDIASSFFYESDVMFNASTTMSKRPVVSERNIIDVISRFDCHKNHPDSRGHSAILECAKENPYNKFEVCLEEKSALLIGNINTICGGIQECISDNKKENMSRYKNNILNKCSKFLPKL